MEKKCKGSGFMKDLRLSEQEERMFMENEKLIHKNIHCYIESAGEYGINSYEDLVQVGRIGLCKAIKTYDKEKAKFSSYAMTVIKNTILSELKSKKNRNRERTDYFEDLNEKETVEQSYELKINLDAQDAYMVVKNCGTNYGGIAEKGVNAIIMMSQGYSCKEIGEVYNVDSKTITAWISRARQKLRKEAAVLELC